MLSSLIASVTKGNAAVESPEYDEESTVKLILLGETATGKTSIALRFASNEFRPYSESTIGASFFEKSMIFDYHNEEDESKKKRNVSFKIWDTAGQEKYRAMTSIYYRGAGAAILVYDISRTSSFRVLQSWATELQQKGPEGIVMIVCGNKVDLDVMGDRKVSTDEAKAYAEDIGAHYIETSARDNTNIQELFEQIAREIPQMPNNTTESDPGNGNGNAPINLGATATPSRSASSCCR